MHEAIPLEKRDWPSKKITSSPVWCSVDLRDGNQALPAPMNVGQKLTFFKQLVKIGFKEIEVHRDLAHLRRVIEGKFN